MLDFFKNPVLFQMLSFAGAFSAILGSIIAGVVYRGRSGERYSAFNHYISELGEWGISRLAWFFNLGLIVCGLCILLSSISLGQLLPGLLSELGMIAGIVAAISLSLVGIFPMNKLDMHIRAAMTYFRLGLVMVFFFTLAIAFQTQNPPLLPRLLSLAGIPAILAFAVFLIYSRTAHEPSQDPLAPLETTRPRFWGMAISEWAIFVTTVPWFLAIALGL